MPNRGGARSKSDPAYAENRVKDEPVFNWIFGTISEKVPKMGYR